MTWPAQQTNVTQCQICHQWYYIGQQHFCQGYQSPPYFSSYQYTYTDMSETNKKLDKIIELLEKIRIKT